MHPIPWGEAYEEATKELLKRWGDYDE